LKKILYLREKKSIWGVSLLHNGAVSLGKEKGRGTIIKNVEKVWGGMTNQQRTSLGFAKKRSFLALPTEKGRTMNLGHKKKKKKKMSRDLILSDAGREEEL